VYPIVFFYCGLHYMHQCWGKLLLLH
jgi:hypothetical protein